jgi:diaminohydroxyphosphoribosylaminopyrimidine deaminase/5-amino-6-(5-phosphoribosylamino)uracil reductase
MTIQSEQFMRRALELAGQGVGRTAPNPPVGAVVVRDGCIVGEGFHPAAGQPHAEVYALRDAGSAAVGADLYVTLEPCCHQGRTGPCTEAVIAAGVRRVTVGVEDPNPRIAGEGIKRLRAAGVEVEVGLLAVECARLIAPFARHILSGLPFVIYKAAMTLDGQIAAASGDSRWVSGAQSRALVHRLRDRVDGIMVGAGTVIADNPRLTTRLEGGGRDPLRIVVDSRLATSPLAHVYSRESAAGVVLITSDEHDTEALRPYREVGVEIIAVPLRNQRLDLIRAMTELGRRDLQCILLEGGGGLAGAMLRAQLLNRVMIFIAPKLIGGSGHELLAGTGVAKMADAVTLNDLRLRPVGEDILIEGELGRVWGKGHGAGEETHVYRTD